MSIDRNSRRGTSLIKPPARFEITAEFLPRQIGSYHLNRNAVLFQDGIVELAIGYPARVDQFLVQRPKLECSQKISALIQGPVVRIEGAANLRSEERRVGKECRSRGSADD